MRWIGKLSISIVQEISTAAEKAPPRTAHERIQPLAARPEQFQIIGREIYLYCPNGMEKPSSPMRPSKRSCPSGRVPILNPCSRRAQLVSIAQSQSPSAGPFLDQKANRAC